MRRREIEEAICTEMRNYNRGKRFPFTAKSAVPVAGIVADGNRFKPNQEVICLQDKCPLAYRCTGLGAAYYESNPIRLLSTDAPSQSLFITPTLSPTENS